jgi:signal transduction histidine kinase
VRVKSLHDRLQAYNLELERRVAERTADLQRALDQLRELDRLKSELIANVSHELRTPLLHVKGTVHLLADGAMGALSPEQARGLGVARRAVEQLERIVEDIVDFSRLGEQRLDLEPVSVDEVCRSVAAALTPAAERKGVSLRLDLAADLPPVSAHRAALARVLWHLLDNAVKFSPPQTVVLVQAERRAARVRLAVRDQGPGIPPENLPRVFDLLYQVDGSSTRRAGGLGLGLALVKALVEAHQSEVRVESEVGRGSTFSFDLPAAEQ